MKSKQRLIFLVTHFIIFNALELFLTALGVGSPMAYLYLAIQLLFFILLFFQQTSLARFGLLLLLLFSIYSLFGLVLVELVGWGFIAFNAPLTERFGFIGILILLAIFKCYSYYKINKEYISISSQEVQKN